MKLTGHIITLLLLTANILAAQTYGPQDSRFCVDEHKIHFKFDKHEVNLSFRDNASSIEALFSDLARLEKVDSICIYGYSNLEGGSEHNKLLSSKRAESLKKYLVDNYYIGLYTNNIKAYGMGENWAGLTQMIRDDYRRYDRDAVLRILTNTEISNDTRKWRLERLDEGYTWVYLKKVYMSNLKYAKVCIYGKRLLTVDEILDEAEAAARSMGRSGEYSDEAPAPDYRSLQKPLETTVTDTIYTLSTIAPTGALVPVLTDSLVVTAVPLTADTVAVATVPVVADTLAVTAVPVAVDKVVIADNVVVTADASPVSAAVAGTTVLAGTAVSPVTTVSTVSTVSTVQQADTLFISAADSLFFDRAQTPQEPVTTLTKDEKNEERAVSEQADSLQAIDSTCRTVVALKTNLLLDAVTALNFAVEVPFGKHFSAEYFQTTPWWEAKSNKFCLQFLSFGGQAKWWFLPRTKPASENLKQRDALVGHYVGLYGWGGWGDLQFGRNLCQQFDFWSAGLTYGYSMPVSRHLNMEFSISFGYANIAYQHYVPTEDWSLLVRDPENAGTLHYFGPTKAEISLVVPIRATIGKKGGRR